MSQTYWNRGVRSHRKGAKRIWVVYSIEEDGKLHTRRVNALEALYYKAQVKRKRRAFCTVCDTEFVGFFRNDKEILNTDCPECNDPDIKLVPHDTVAYLAKLLSDP